MKYGLDFGGNLDDYFEDQAEEFYWEEDYYEEEN